MACLGCGLCFSGVLQGKFKQSVKSVYMVLPRSQLESLQDLNDDDLRVAAVSELSGSIIGRPLKEGGVQLLSAILQQRCGMGLAAEAVTGAAAPSMAGAAVPLPLQ